MSFTIFQNEKTPFQAIKRRSSKSRKIDIFQKGLTHGLGPKMAIFPTVFFVAIQARKMSFTIFQNEKTPFQTRKARVQKVIRLTFFQRGQPMVLVQKWPFFQVFFLGNFSQETVAFFPTFFFLANFSQENAFYDILERKNTFLGYENEKIKKSKK